MSEHREALEEKVVARRKQLQEAFTLAERDGPPERRTSLEATLRLVDNAVQGGWDKVDQVGAAELTKWLDSTQSMVAADAPKVIVTDPPKEPLPTPSAPAQ